MSAHFLARVSHDLGRPPPKGISPSALAFLQSYGWPGNVRELRNVIERALILHPGIEELRPEHLPAEITRTKDAGPPAEAAGGPLSLEDTERRMMVEALDKTLGNQTQAAKLLGISRDTMRYRMRRHGLDS